MKGTEKILYVIVVIAACDSILSSGNAFETPSRFWNTLRSKRFRRYIVGGIDASYVGPTRHYTNVLHKTRRYTNVVHTTRPVVNVVTYTTQPSVTVANKMRQVPWQAGIRRWDQLTRKYEAHCGGTIIERYWILSAAHCFISTQNATHYKVRVGDIDNTKLERDEQEFDVARITLHPSFNKCVYGSCDYDLAYVRIRGSGVQYTENVQRAYLPGRYNVIPQEDCYISGWGRTTNKEWDTGTSVLQVAKVKVFNQAGQDECAEAYPNLVTDKMLCAGYLNGTRIDACEGDSGGPLVCKIKGQNVLVGITSWGAKECAKTGHPGIYSNVKTIMF